MNRYENRAIALSILVAAIGIGLSSYTKQGQYFGRSGAIITMIAIIFASLELRKRAAGATLFVKNQLISKRVQLIAQFTSGGLSNAAAEAAYQKMEAEIESEVSNAIREASRRLLRIEVILLVAGTLIWGFGDLFFDGLPKSEKETRSSSESAYH